MSASLHRIIDVLIDQDEDGVWIVRSPQLPGIVEQGETEGEALANYKAVFWFSLESEGIVRAQR